MSKIEDKVMASVAAIYVVRALLSRKALSLYVFVFSLLGITTLVSLTNVVHNLQTVMAHGLPSVVTFIVSAILGTKLLVQLALVIATGASLLFLTDLARTTRARSSSFA